jgi:hypothetical protein
MGLRGEVIYHILFTHNCFNGEKGLHELLGECHVVLDLQVNPSCGFFGGSSSLTLFIHYSLFTPSILFNFSLIHSCSWNETMGANY